ncbi:DUF732 domain-containing protein [Microbacterium sp. MAHUQ-60]|uniref:DUF732 domain-containing protein n=1 Tax=unclassified Microbacterium TaxID=2609290 RepID=UPI00360BB09A
MAMNADGDSTAAQPMWKRPKFLITVAALAVLVIGGSVTASVIAQNAAAAQAATHAAADKAAKAAADKAAEAAHQAELKAAHETSIRLGNEALVAYEARYTESVDYGAPDARAKLRATLDALSAILEQPDATTDDLDIARGAANAAFRTVGSHEDAEAQIAKAAAEKARVEADALDKIFTTLVNASDPDATAVYDFTAIAEGQTYCADLAKSSTPDNIISTQWSGGPAFSDIQNAAIRVYCPQFVPPMELLLSGFGGGDHVVGGDIKAGTYKTVGSVSDCYWERNDGSGQIIDNNFVTAAHKGLTVRVKNGEGFSSSGCGYWLPVK